MKLALLAAIGATVVTTGCATAISGSTKTVQINAQEGANISVINADGRKVLSGTGALTAELPRGAGYWRPAGYQVKVSQPGYQSKSVDLLPAFNTWYLINFIPYIGIIGGLIVDPISGAFYTLDKDQLDIRLDPVGGNAELALRLSEAERSAKNFPVSRHDYTGRQKAKETGCAPIASPRVDRIGAGLEKLTFQCLDGKTVALTCSSYEGCISAN